MKIPKPSEDDKSLFRDLVPERPDVEVKAMFDNLGAFVNGNMFMGLFGSSIGLKLVEADRARLSAIHGAGPFGPEERPMAGYVSMPASWRTKSGNGTALDLARARACCGTAAEETEEALAARLAVLA